MSKAAFCSSTRHGWLAVLMGILTSLYVAYGNELQRTRTYPGITAEVVGDGPPIVLIPGLNSTAEVWQGTVEGLRERYQLHVLTLGGFGGTAAVDGPFLETVRDSVLAYVEGEGLDRPVVVGHSLGGFLAFSVASAAPAVLGGIVAVDGVPFLPALLDPSATIDSIRPRAEGMRSFLASMSAEQLAAQARASGLAGGDRALDLVERMAGQSDPAAAGQAAYELMTTDLQPEVSKIAVPTLLIIAGEGADTEEARKSLLQRYRAQVRSIPDHRLAVVEGARHFVMLDAPETFQQTLEAFLAEVAGPATSATAPETGPRASR